MLLEELLVLLVNPREAAGLGGSAAFGGLGSGDFLVGGGGLLAQLLS